MSNQNNNVGGLSPLEKLLVVARRIHVAVEDAKTASANPKGYPFIEAVKAFIVDVEKFLPTELEQVFGFDDKLSELRKALGSGHLIPAALVSALVAEPKIVTVGLLVYNPQRSFRKQEAKIRALAILLPALSTNNRQDMVTYASLNSDYVLGLLDWVEGAEEAQWAREAIITNPSLTRAYESLVKESEYRSGLLQREFESRQRQFEKNILGIDLIQKTTPRPTAVKTQTQQATPPVKRESLSKLLATGGNGNGTSVASAKSEPTEQKSVFEKLRAKQVSPEPAAILTQEMPPQEEAVDESAVALRLIKAGSLDPVVGGLWIGGQTPSLETGISLLEKKAISRQEFEKIWDAELQA